jgi:hypothetical protein
MSSLRNYVRNYTKDSYRREPERNAGKGGKQAG